MAIFSLTSRPYGCSEAAETGVWSVIGPYVSTPNPVCWDTSIGAEQPDPDYLLCHIAVDYPPHTFTAGDALEASWLVFGVWASVYAIMFLVRAARAS
ncbi:MAG: hypothetical protein Q7U99_18390 [Rubrivivax sp.]|nr:hypothetical protein [Rubrivivax sp.]